MDVASKPNGVIKLITLVITFLICSLSAQQWQSVGPDGGDARSLAADPHRSGRILLGTSAGQLYESVDSGASWQRIARLGESNDYVIDHILFDPSHDGVVYAGAWSVEDTSGSKGGDVFRSKNNGKTWVALKGMHGESVRALAMSASEPNILVAGTLSGVFRTTDGGDTWERIAPDKNTDLKNFESVVIDPRNPDTIYAGTWHLPWKTTDGGKTWKNIKNGIIDDSDVFSIILDAKNADTVYASACSGIYRSDNAGAQFRKVQGIPYSSRRTRMLRQDPRDARLVYAGTTEGLFKTLDGGNSWTRTTSGTLIVNDILTDPARPNHVLLATDRAGVLASEDNGNTFVASTRGFAHRQVAALLTDQSEPSTIYAGVLNDKEYGGVFVTHSYGAKWDQMSIGLDGRDVFALRRTAAGELVAGTNNGVFIWRTAEKEDTPQWQPLNNVFTEVNTPVTAIVGSKLQTRTFAHVEKSELALRVGDLLLGPERWWAASLEGLYSSKDNGESWYGGVKEGLTDFVRIHENGAFMLAIARRGLLVSNDGGEHWQRLKLPAGIGPLADAGMDSSGTLYVAALDGGYRSLDGGKSWELMKSLPLNRISAVQAEEGDRVMMVSPVSGYLFESRDHGATWQFTPTGWGLRSVNVVSGRIIAASAFDGIITQPTGVAIRDNLGTMSGR